MAFWIIRRASIPALLELALLLLAATMAAGYAPMLAVSLVEMEHSIAIRCPNLQWMEMSVSSLTKN